MVLMLLILSTALTEFPGLGLVFFVVDNTYKQNAPMIIVITLP